MLLFFWVLVSHFVSTCIECGFGGFLFDLIKPFEIFLFISLSCSFPLCCRDDDCRVRMDSSQTLVLSEKSSDITQQDVDEGKSLMDGA